MKQFDGKTALVTGGRSGIGQAIATELQEQGATVYTAQRHADSNFPSIQADFADETSAAAIIKELIATTGQLDILVNNAGEMFERTIADTKVEEWQHMMMVNITTPFLLIQAALPYLKKTKGTIINIGSIEGIGANPGHTAYATSKAAIHGLTRSVAVDLGQDGITCNAIAPGWIDTELNDAFIASMEDPKAFREEIAGIHPAGRTGTPQDVAALACFLASEARRFITGQTYVIDGGRMVKLSLP